MTLNKDDKIAYAWIDGASSGNPGPAGAGAVLKQADKELGRWNKHLGIATNNIAEYQALILALTESLKLGVTSLVVFTDSELLHRQYIGRYKVKNPGIKELFSKVMELKARFKTLRIEHIPREKNKEADKLAREAKRI